jgi:hypothetical protein
MPYDHTQDMPEYSQPVGRLNRVSDILRDVIQVV